MRKGLKYGKMIKSTLITIVLYALFFFGFVMLDKFGRQGGPCNPGIATFYILFGLPILVILLLILHSSFISKGRKDMIPSLIIDLALFFLIFISILILFL